MNPPPEGPSSGSEPQSVAALAASIARLDALVEPMRPEDLRRGAYPTEWTIADVLSHLGSGAVISEMRLDAALAGEEIDMDKVRSVWDDWNAKTPDAQAADAGHADRSLLGRLVSLSDAERAGFHSSLGPMELDFAGFVGLRLNEHAVHTWDIAVTIDPTAQIPGDATTQLVDNLGMIARFAGKPVGSERTVTVRTTGPDRHLEVVLGPDAVRLTTIEPVPVVDVELPAEAFVRLVYGRLDPDHTPAFVGDQAALDELGHAFPGF